MKIKLNNEKLIYSGRIDWSNEKEPVFIFPCTSLSMRFTGATLRVRIRNRSVYEDNYLGCILDGEQVAYRLPESGEEILEMEVKPNPANEHALLLFKRQAACHELTLLEIEIGDGERLLEPAAKPERRIEVYGDSVSAGEVSEAVSYVGKEDPEHNGEFSNSWYSYAWMTARKLQAQIHDIAQGGIALMDGTGWFCAPDYVGMETVWDKVHYNPELGGMTEWDFESYMPQVVIVAIGQNDSNPCNFMAEDNTGAQACMWRSKYKRFLGDLRGKYPDAYIICITTLLNHDPSWDHAIEEVCREIEDDKVSHYMFRRNGRGTPGHLRIPEAEEMAEELAAYIESLRIEGW